MTCIAPVIDSAESILITEIGNYGHEQCFSVGTGTTDPSSAQIKLTGWMSQEKNTGLKEREKWSAIFSLELDVLHS